MIDTRNGLIEGRVSRIDPSILNGTVTVDVALIMGKDAPPPGVLRPDLSVDGTIELERLNEVVFVGRPVFGQQDSTVRLFKLEPDGKYRERGEGGVGAEFGEHHRDQGRTQGGRPGDSLGYVGLRQLRPN